MRGYETSRTLSETHLFQIKGSTAMSAFSVEDGAFSPEITARRDALAKRIKNIAEAVYRLCEAGKIDDEEIFEAARRLRMRFSSQDLDVCLAALQAVER